MNTSGQKEEFRTYHKRHSLGKDRIIGKEGYCDTKRKPKDTTSIDKKETPVKESSTYQMNTGKEIGTQEHLAALYQENSTMSTNKNKALNNNRLLQH